MTRRWRGAEKFDFHTGTRPAQLHRYCIYNTSSFYERLDEVAIIIISSKME